MTALSPLVIKFGGAALADGGGVGKVCDVIEGAGERVIVVVSAHKGVTAL
jgi:aspartokinase